MPSRVRNIFLNSKQTVDCIVLKNGSMPYIDENFYYVTNLDQGLFEGACAILHQDGSLDLLTSELEAESAQKAAARLHVYKTKDEFSSQLRTILAPFHTV